MVDNAIYPLIDLFAGPGGLGEGFANAVNGKSGSCFKCVLSVETDVSAHQTLLLRHFIHAFNGDIPQEYYDFLEEEITIEELYEAYPDKHEAARKSALKLSLCPGNRKSLGKKIEERLGENKNWVLVGGPPCQSYSLIGRPGFKKNEKFFEDKRHGLYREYLKVVRDHEPAVFVMENVRGLLSLKINGKSIINKIINDLSKPKPGLRYNLHSIAPGSDKYDETDHQRFLVKSEQHGIPQSRHRIFIVGVRSDIGIVPKKLRRRKAPNVSQTIGNLPDLRSGLSKIEDNFSNWKKTLTELRSVDFTSHLEHGQKGKITNGVSGELKNRNFPEKRKENSAPGKWKNTFPALTYMHDECMETIIDHETRSHIEGDIQRYFFAAVFARTLKYSPKLVDFPEYLQPNHKNAEQGRQGKIFADRFRVQLANSVSSTITSHIAKDGHHFIHYDPKQARSLTVREAARLQTFPDNYKFLGNRTSQYQQVGNAVPPYLAKQIGEIVAEILDKAKAKN